MSEFDNFPIKRFQFEINSFQTLIYIILYNILGYLFNFIYFLVALTKCDLPNRQVDYNVVANFAYDSRILLVEVSADMQICVKDAFYSLVREIRDAVSR